MISFFLTIGRLLRNIADGWRDPEFRGLFSLVLTVLAGGTLFYRSVEGWSALDAAYFSVMTLTTVGYGDLTPTTPLSKVFTMAYVVVGIGLLLAFIDHMAVQVVARRSRVRD